MRYEFINPDAIPDYKTLSFDKEYSTRIVKVGFKDGDIHIQMEYLGEALPRNSHKCLLPLIREPDVEIEDNYIENERLDSCIHCLSKSCVGNCRESDYDGDDN